MITVLHELLPELIPPVRDLGLVPSLLLLGGYAVALAACGGVAIYLLGRKWAKVDVNERKAR